jgi:hypothetical protein
VDSCPRDLERGKKDARVWNWGQGAQAIWAHAGESKRRRGKLRPRAQMRGQERGRGDEQTPSPAAAVVRHCKFGASRGCARAAREVAERGREAGRGKLQARESLGAGAGEEAGVGAGGIGGGDGTVDPGRRRSSLPNGFPAVSMRLGARVDAVPS